ncbi:MAG: tRNA (N(6)-L-threonylcarbamoyladenosine(37)-C(2))-methylthiotransferase MtaB [Patescibacteria group bacterium]
MRKNEKTFKIYTLGCKVNQYDSRYLSELLTKQGFSRVGENAELTIINTCSVTASAISKDKRMISKARKENPKSKIIIMGCWPRAYRKEVDKAGADLVWGVGKLKDLVAYIHGLLGYKMKKINEPFDYIPQENRSRYFLKIQDGCEQYCSYCIIPHTRGNIKSRKEGEILKEAEGATQAGFKEIVLSGIHLGMYGKDTNTNIAELLKKMINIPDLGRIRLSSIEINEVSDNLVALLKASPKICDHLHIPLQSGSDKILKLMKRPYTSQYFEKKINEIKKELPNISVSTDVIAGFPGEGEKEFEETYNMVKRLKFSRLHVFPFSAHKKTSAYKLSGRVPGADIKRRVAGLIELGEKMEIEFMEKFKGRELDVLVENIEKGKMRGRSEYYFCFELPLDRIIFCDQGEKIDDPSKMIGKIFKIKEKTGFNKEG